MLFFSAVVVNKCYPWLCKHYQFEMKMDVSLSLYGFWDNVSCSLCIFCCNEWWLHKKSKIHMNVYFKNGLDGVRWNECGWLGWIPFYAKCLAWTQIYDSILCKFSFFLLIPLREKRTQIKNNKCCLFWCLFNRDSYESQTNFIIYAKEMKLDLSNKRSQTIFEPIWHNKNVRRTFIKHNFITRWEKMYEDQTLFENI